MKTGILLTNLGTPDAPTKAALKRYLKEFLSDDRVIQPKNKLIWWLALNVVILNIRPVKSAQNYVKIWDSFGKGSPLLNITLLQAQGVEKILTNKFDDLALEMGMRYGNPSIDSALEKLQAQGCEKIVVLPLYPQYSDTTTASTLDTVNKALGNWDNKPKLDFIDNYYTDKGYIQSLALSVIEHQEQHGKPDKLMISFHGIPQRFVDNGDIYYEHCVNTSVLLTEALNLQDKDYQLCFQSIFGREEWIKPQTKLSLESLAQDGVEHIQVICPGFSADCLETLEEINEENRGYFIQAGGKTFSYIPALNDRKDHIKALSNIISKHLE
ncbi:Ferrochelatase, protoheme ferro-lyase (EC [Bathymodiolus thermophilus thioautotrophic gill symbiont]|jgi:ferrochelatase|uniref:Ferrochelatase n=3 Tax=sulfur-oxidizing symbionts TaxID=32036 RepID=A0A1H6JVT8_9GAMM|nr:MULTISPECIES: ferrochelatase [Gammaproteobacteria]CAC9504537.1 Ferrochelatase, protoheme ferro-lyase (EC 4.99.1.1) [uncultured Gammaproteobacteria bacterium]CAB5496801.1 Ferrochelatase, protoheme ferro-lyase (EC [Bathymodiolus azoricus thioautotrophic gill symbiont]CAB5508076.1 Ferrochelatase, protoheme ferro-lyase (EC [Bathymodiolus thermophilus thioautotrophic gill symbiont]CAC9521161.1 Ferrochelatase, protoheme ferro-lyase (EC 4.99.1.1) [uncultured Gammaproteobacteria bacterium]CAC953370